MHLLIIQTQEQLPTSDITTITNTPTLLPTTIKYTYDEVKHAVAQKAGIAVSDVEVSVSKDRIEESDMILIRGTVKNKADPGGAGFFAAITKQGIDVFYIGQGVPNCSSLQKYNVPVTWADYCLDTNGKTVKR